MSNHKSIQWIFDQLANDEASRRRFNTISLISCFVEDVMNIGTLRFIDPYAFGDPFKNDFPFNELSQYHPDKQQYIIRTALSCVDGQAVISALEGETIIESTLIVPASSYVPGIDIADHAQMGVKHYISISEALYLTFDESLRQGKPLTEAFEALDQKFEELKIV